MQDRHVDDLVDAYALGALELDEVDLVERHTAHCAGCAERLREAQAIARELLYGGVTPVAPSPDVRARVLASITEEAHAAHLASPALADDREANAPPLAPQAAAPPPGNPLTRWLRSVFGTTAPDAADILLREFLADPECVIVPIAPTEHAPGASGRLVGTPRAHQAIVLTAGLPPTPSDRAYQVWFLRGGTPQPNALFRVGRSGRGTSVVNVEQPLSTFEVIAITPEPASGSPGPTGPIVLAGEVASAHRA